jgi:hypothetical protein
MPAFGVPAQSGQGQGAVRLPLFDPKLTSDPAGCRS